MLSARAAAENDPASTTRTKACIAASRSMLIPSRNGDYRHTASAASLALRSPYRSRRQPAVRATSEDQMTLQAKLAFKAGFDAGKPPYTVSRSVIDTMHQATAELITSRAAARAQDRRHRTALRADGSG